jgi:hypothetical protein
MTLVLAGATAVALGLTEGQDETRRAKARAEAAATDADVTYGRIKELVAGQKVVINIDNAPDKTFDLSDKDVTVKLDKGLKVGDPVKLNKRDVADKTKTITITKHSGGGRRTRETTLQIKSRN